MSATDRILHRLQTLADPKYKAFQQPLIPNIEAERFLGVRTPLLRALAKEMLKDGTAAAFISSPLPHSTFDEMQLHAFIISGTKDFREALAQTEHLLPYVDNWATCDQLSPAVFRKHTEELLPAIRRWMQAEHEYTVRFGIGMLMRYYLDAPMFREEYLETVAGIQREEYYIRMMQAWYFATALAKQYAATLPYIADRRLPTWTHRMTIRKACESLRLTDAQKAQLKALRQAEG